MLTVALLVMTAARSPQLADLPIVVHCDYVPRIQEVQASVYHILREMQEVLSRGQV